MMGFLFILVVLLMAVGFSAVIWNGWRLVLVDPQPSYYIVEEDDRESLR